MNWMQSNDCNYGEVIPVGCGTKSYLIPFPDPIMKARLMDFETILDKYNSERILLSEGEFIYHIELRIC